MSNTTTMGIAQDTLSLFEGEGLIQNETYELKDYPKPVSVRQTMPLQEFFKLPNFPINRDVEKRAKKAISRLIDPMHKHAEVDVLHYTGPDTKKPGFFKHNRKYLLDGNTRQHVWSSYFKGQPIDINVIKMPMPRELIVNTYEINDATFACDLYNIIDSPEAVETKPDKITGALRGNNMLGNLQNRKIKKGEIAGALKIACPYGGRTIFTVPNVTDLTDQVQRVKEPLTWLDKMNVVGDGHFHVQFPTGMALLAGLAMDCNDRWLEVVGLLATKKEDIDKTDWKQDVYGDAVYALQKGTVSNPINVDCALPYKIGQGQHPAIVQNYLAYCWTHIINNNKLRMNDVTVSSIVNSYSDLLRDVYGND